MKIPLHLEFRKPDIEITYINTWIGYIDSTYIGFLGYSWIYQTAKFDPKDLIQWMETPGFLLKNLDKF